MQKIENSARARERERERDRETEIDSNDFEKKKVVRPKRQQPFSEYNDVNERHLTEI